MSRLVDQVADELARPVGAEAQAFAGFLAEQAKGGCAGVLFYGSGLRSGALDGLLDFYVLLDRPEAWPQPKMASWAMQRLPPNVEYRERETPAGRVRAKVAVMSLERFVEGVRPESLDTTLWARFAQPCALTWSRDAAAAQRVAEAAAQAVRTASGYAAALGPEEGPAGAYWTALFRATYAAELRVEDKGRAGAILGYDDARYTSLLPLAWEEAGIGFEPTDGGYRLTMTPDERRSRLATWRRRRAAGRPLNLARLVKAAFTFEGAADYVAWKVERHTGYRLPLTPWRRRHPLLSGPWALWRLWRAGVLR